MKLSDYPSSLADYLSLFPEEEINGVWYTHTPEFDVEHDEDTDELRVIRGTIPAEYDHE